MLGGVAFLLLLLWAGTAGAAEVNHPSSHTCSISTPVFLPLIARSFRHPQGYLIESGSLGYYLLWTLLMLFCFLDLPCFSRARSGLLSCSCPPASYLPCQLIPSAPPRPGPLPVGLTSLFPSNDLENKLYFVPPLKDLCLCLHLSPCYCLNQNITHLH